MTDLAHYGQALLYPDASRVIARLYLPGEELPTVRSRASGVVERILALSEEQVESMAAELVLDYGARHQDYLQLLAAHASRVSSHVHSSLALTPARVAVLGATFTAEYAVEAAALCNPSAVRHPDQDGLLPDQLRVAVSLRGIGEGHISSIGFCSAIIGPGLTWQFEERAHPVVTAASAGAAWRREQLRAVLIDQNRLDELAHTVLATLPEEFTNDDLHAALTGIQRETLARPGGAATADLLRRLMGSAYEVSFSAETLLSQRVLMPAAAEESNGMEDARFVRFTEPDGTTNYRATYTAYDGTAVAPRLLTSPDLRTFRAHRLAGPAARNKGMALFPRTIHGKYWSLCRSDGENTSIATSPDGLVWGSPELLQAPEAAWEVLQIGNCGPPLETADGWLVLTHGVGPMRAYAIGAILLDLDDPRRIVKRLQEPLVQASSDQREGYVPNVVYSCGSVIHDGVLWLPYGIADSRIGVSYVAVDELLAAMAPVVNS